MSFFNFLNHRSRQNVNILAMGIASCIAIAATALSARAQDIFYSDYPSSASYIGRVSASGAVSVYASGTPIVQPVGISFDPSGNLYIANPSGDGGNGSIAKVTVNGAVTTVATSNYQQGLQLITVLSVAYGPDGNIYAYSQGYTAGGQILKITPSGVITTMASHLGAPCPCMVFGPDSNLYFTNQTGGTIRRMTLSGVVSTAYSGFNHPYGLAFDSSGNLYVSHAGGTGGINRITPAGVITAIGSGIANPSGLTFDSSDNLYIITTPNGASPYSITKLTPAGVLSTYGSGLNYPQNLAFSPLL